MNDRNKYKASAWGNEFHALPHREALGAGSAGPGKTTVLIYDPMPLISHEHDRAINSSNPHYFGLGGSVAHDLYLRRTSKSLEQIIDRTKKIFPLIDPGVVWSEGKKMWSWSSGLKYQFGHCRDPGDNPGQRGRHGNADRRLSPFAGTGAAGTSGRRETGADRADFAGHLAGEFHREM